ncbi:hypothetical protein WA026_023106 [Henosepilachna vigintioctopunctata]|uniref:Uncharacterized protein n=1 Tax=Henosepilachna vigintioctopunctata TaxID=420089 RepID=A0AAW1UCI0_9CUCU
MDSRSATPNLDIPKDANKPPNLKDGYQGPVVEEGDLCSKAILSPLKSMGSPGEFSRGETLATDHRISV